MSLPEGWVETTLGEVGKIVTGKTPKKKNPEFFDGEHPFVKPSDLDKDIFVTDTIETLSDSGLVTVPNLPKGAVMVTCIGNMGKVGIAGQVVATNQQINSIIPNEEVLDSKYLYYYAKTLKPWMDRESSATTISIINKSTFSKAPIILPPLKEQKQIAQKLDQALARVERIKMALDNTPDTIKRFRQSVLALATSGGLSEGREYCNIQVNEENYMLVRGWKLLEILNFSLKTRPAIKSGPFGSLLKKHEHIDTGIPVLGIENIDNMYFKYGSKIHISEEKALDLAVYDIQSDDIIISRSGTVGEICKVPSNIGVARYSTNIIRVVLDNDLVSSDYFCFLFQGNNLVLNQVKDLCKGSTRVFLNKTILSNIKFPIPPLEEQKAIVKKVETLFALADNLEVKVNQAQKRVDRLTQSILAKAFRGEL